MNVVATILIFAAAVIGLVIARTFWGPLKWPAYAFAAWLAVLLMGWPLSATHVWKHGLGVAWYITVAVLAAVVIVIFYGFVAYLLLRAGRAIVHRLR